jgi:hypothetical protein
MKFPRKTAVPLSILFAKFRSSEARLACKQQYSPKFSWSRPSPNLKSMHRPKPRFPRPKR